MKRKQKILVWAGGLLTVFLIWYFSSSEPDFIADNGIITFSTLGIFFVLLTCNYIVCGKPFFYKKTFNDIESKIKNCEKRLAIIDAGMQDICRIVSNNFEVLEKKRENFEGVMHSAQSSLYNNLHQLESQINTMEDGIKNLSARVFEHTWDCHPKYECGGCGAIFNDVHTFENGEGICEKCHECNYFEMIKQSFHKS